MGTDKNPEEEAPDEEFQSQDSGASAVYPIEAGCIRKGGLIMIKNRPCKVTEVTSSKTGKHGHAKCHFVAADIFTGKKIEDLVPASHTTYAPFVKKTEYQCLDVDEDGFLSLMDAGGEQREDIKTPDLMAAPLHPDAAALAKRIRDFLGEDKDFFVVLQSACGHEQIMDTKVMTA